MVSTNEIAMHFILAIFGIWNTIWEILMCFNINMFFREIKKKNT